MYLYPFSLKLKSTDLATQTKRRRFRLVWPKQLNWLIPTPMMVVLLISLAYAVAIIYGITRLIGLHF